MMAKVISARKLLIKATLYYLCALLIGYCTNLKVMP